MGGLLEPPQSNILYPDRDVQVCAQQAGEKGALLGLLLTPFFSPAHGWLSPRGHIKLCGG